MTNLADRLVVVFGLNVTLTLQVAPAGSVEGQFSVIANHDAYVPVIPMLPMVNDVLPLFVTVVTRGPAVAPTATLPNLRLVGLTDAAGVTVNVLDFLMPFAVPEMDAVFLLATWPVTMSNGTDCSPWGTTMLAATG
jgi:hypothetical protein